ncbi:spore germination protein [Neobacillus novalis]|uniref:Spore germination protein n=1 Tax=Neobacillus novalis TaxID=220687 RepID=A0AA95MVE2_9BACI|nr:spore germination protein [Neobacillus novalis]WHY88780.1 spore germination protein [Neobacillus novalis]
MVRQDGISIGTVSGGIVNFGGAEIIAPITITKTVAGSGSENAGQTIITNSGLNPAQQKKLKELKELVETVL